jgi:hypothetical protein
VKAKACKKMDERINKLMETIKGSKVSIVLPGI